jgi:hypothetical protein
MFAVANLGATSRIMALGIGGLIRWAGPSWGRSGSSPVIDSQSIPGRQGDRQPTAGEPTPERQPPRLRLVRPTGEHVERLLDFVHEHYRPGEVLEHADMVELYEQTCEYFALVSRKWNPIAARLKNHMGRGPKGGRKTYQRVLRADGSEQQTRIWVVPERQSARHQAAPEPDLPPVASAPLARAA